MICSLNNLRDKEVIDITTGERLGYIDDVEINLEKSVVIALIIYGRERFWGLLGKENDIIIPCTDIQVVGNDVLLIKRSNTNHTAYATNNKLFQPESLLK